MSQNYAYIRVSAKDQNEERQLIAMAAQGIKRRNIFSDKKSGKDFERPGYQKMLDKLRSGDTLFIVSIDRLGRNYREILEQWRILTREKGVSIVVLDMPLLDTREKEGLVGVFISDLVLQLLSFVAENERNNIRTRQRAGIEAAKQRGVRFGRPREPVPENFGLLCESWRAGEISGAAAARQCGMPATTFRYRAKQWLKSQDSCKTREN